MNKIVLSALCVANFTACVKKRIEIQKKSLPHLCIINNTDRNITIHSNGKQYVIYSGNLQSILITDNSVAQTNHQSVQIANIIKEKPDNLVQTIKASTLFNQ